MSRSDRFLKACRMEAVDTVPIWLMRQAGRYMPEYRALRAKHSMLEMIHTPDLAAEVTLQPVKAFDLDAAIIFADILPLADSLGLGLDFVEGVGPRFQNPLSSPEDIQRLAPPDVRESLKGTLTAISKVRKELDQTVPLIGFAGAPYTLASYMLEMKSEDRVAEALKFAEQEPSAWSHLMEILAHGTVDYLRAQVEAGAQALQLFDSWAGQLPPDRYRALAAPWTRYIFEGLSDLDCPLIHFATGSRGIFPELVRAGGTVLGVDESLPLRDARTLTRDRVALQGNLPPTLLADGTTEEIHDEARLCIQSMADRNGYIFNLGHGVLKHTDPARVRDLIQFVHETQPNPGT